MSSRHTPRLCAGLARPGPDGRRPATHAHPAFSLRLVLRAVLPARSSLGCWNRPGLPWFGRHGSRVAAWPSCLTRLVPGVTRWGQAFQLWSQRSYGGAGAAAETPESRAWKTTNPTPVQASGKLTSLPLRTDLGGGSTEGGRIQSPTHPSTRASPPCSDPASSPCTPASGWPAQLLFLGPSASPALGSVQGQLSGGRRLCLRHGFLTALQLPGVLGRDRRKACTPPPGKRQVQTQKDCSSGLHEVRQVARTGRLTFLRAPQEPWDW